MAISQKNYVSITSRFPVASSSERILGGLVFTKAQMNEGVSAELLQKKRAYDAGELVALEYDDAVTLFNTTDATSDSNEAAFANNYYGYSSPNGYVPCSLKFARVMSTNVPVYATGTAYAQDDYVEYHGFVYKFNSAITAEVNTYFIGANRNFSASAILAYDTTSSGYSVGAYFTHTASSITKVYKALKEISISTAFDTLTLGTDYKECEVSDYATGTQYSVDDVVSRTANDTTSYYNCTAILLAEDNHGWADCCSVTLQESSFPTYEYETASAALARVDASDNSFGSFTFLDSGTLTFNDAELQAAVTLNSGYSTRYLACVERAKGTMSAAEMVSKKEDCCGDGSDGCAFVQGSGALSAYMPMAIFAATDYDDGEEVPCQMYKQFGNETPTVFNDADYTELSENFVNFYGQSQSNGKRINFYQRGFNTDGTDTSVYCNEIWFKSRCLTRLMSMFIGKERVPANNEGLAMVSYEVGEVCTTATINGAFMTKTVGDGDALEMRKLIVKSGGTTALADEAIKAIGNVGYYVWTYLYQDSGEYKIGYYVFYGTADSVRFVKGDDVLVK